ncbi:hypothetical protein [Bacillus phage PK16]|nr:hypothetical protein [Bacillus phage PK16]AUM58860.1 hypothetical protein BCP01_058 [Bacillus phage BCP01]
MTHVFTERMAILKKMDYIEKERALLLAEYNSCFDRLRELDEIDRMSAEADHVAEVMKEAYAPEPTKKKVIAVRTPKHKLSDEDIERISVRVGDMFANTEEEPKPTPIEMTSEQLKATLLDREKAEDLALLKRVTGAELKITDEDIVTTKHPVHEDEDLLSTEVVDVPVHKEGQTLQEYFEENKELLGDTVEVKEDKPKEEPKKAPVGEASSLLQMKPSFMRGTTNDNRIIAQFAKVILKDMGVPIKAKKLLEKLRDAGIVMKSPYETLAQIRNYEPSIQKAGHGYYQYVPTR